MSGSPGDKTGPLSVDELQAIWSAAVDVSYRQPLLTAGVGNGFEAYTQGFAQLARVSEAVDRSIQSMYILPFSGQSNPPAGSPVQATVTLSFFRTGFADRAIVLGAGTIWIDEDAKDAGENGPEDVDTGRRYVLTETRVIFPGEIGPIAVRATAEKPGYGYNNPLPGTLSIIEQVGADFSNVLAEVTLTSGVLPPLAPNPASSATLTTQNEPDTFVPEQIGTYVIFTNGANAGRTGRIVSFTPPDPSSEPPEFPNGLGSIVGLELLAVVTCTTTVPLIGGEFATLAGATSGSAQIIESRVVNGHYTVAFIILAGSVASGTTITGAQSLATTTVDLVLADGTFVAEAPSGGIGGASWRMMNWALDWGLTSTNALSPVDGQAGMLDLLGADRGLPRASGEGTEAYRARISTIADVVTPNAIRRALNRNADDRPWCFREVGSTSLPGIFYDRHFDPSGDSYDDGSLLFAGAYTSGQFLFAEPVEYRRGLSVLARGYWGSYVPSPGGLPAPVPTALASAGADFTLVLSRDKFADPFPSVAPVVADAIVGLQSGAIFQPSGAIPDSTPVDREWSVYLDYLEFRAFFVVTVPPRGDGEFGFAYDDPRTTFGESLTRDAYDAQPFLDFYDGYPAATGAYFGRLWNAVEVARAGGVSWELVESSSAC